jgi:hypothetical protein
VISSTLLSAEGKKLRLEVLSRVLRLLSLKIYLELELQIQGLEKCWENEPVLSVCKHDEGGEDGEGGEGGGGGGGGGSAVAARASSASFRTYSSS